MDWKFWEVLRPGKIPSNVRKVLNTEFGIHGAELEALRCVKKFGRKVDNRVKLMRIFSVDESVRNNKGIRSYDDLDEHKESIRFSGHVDGEGFVFLSKVG